MTTTTVRLRKDAAGRRQPRFRKGDRVVWAPRRHSRAGVIPDKVYRGTVEGQPKSGNRDSVWVRFNQNVLGSGGRLYMVPVVGLRRG